MRLVVVQTPWCGFGNGVRTREVVDDLAKALDCWIADDPCRAWGLLASMRDLRRSIMASGRLAA